VKASINVKNQKEAAAIRVALERPDVRAFVVIVGTLEALPSDRSRARVLNYVVDKLDEEKFDFVAPSVVTE